MRVFFFGGYGSTWGDVDAWGTSFEGKVSGSSVTLYLRVTAGTTIERPYGAPL